MTKDIEPKLQDLTHLDWSESVVSSATGGSFLKARSGEGAEATYYKLSCYDETNGIYGHECVNEIIASRLMDVLFIPHVAYRLVHARIHVDGREHQTWLAESRSFRKRGESKMSLSHFYGLNRLEGEGRLQFCERFGWMPGVKLAMLVDYLIANRDRHGANLEVIKTRDGSIRLAPLFDNGVSLCFSSYRAELLRAVDPLQDITANNFLGSRSLEENLLKHVPANLPIGRLREAHKSNLVGGLAPALDHAVEGVDGREVGEFLWSMIWKRWCWYENLRDSGRLQTQG